MKGTGAALRAETGPVRAWVPEPMEPGTLFLLEQGESEEASHFRAVLACPACGTLGLVTRVQYEGGQAMICSSPACSAEYSLSDEQIFFRRAQ